MAAAIKMDELLVSWLGSDSMYEDVMNLIEEHKLAAQKQQQQQQQQSQHLEAEEDGDTKTSNDAESSNKEGDKTTMDDVNASNSSDKKNSNDDGNSQDSPRCVIPKFYLGDPTRPRRRRRLLPMPQSDTWEPLPEGEQQLPEDKNKANSNENTVNTSTTAGGGNDEFPMELATIPSFTGPMLCVRDQVQAVFHEIGRGGADNATTTPVQEKIISVQEFVRITKDVFRFPTFFNVPLCQRLLYLWKVHNDKQETIPTSATAAMEGEPAPEEPITYEMVEWYWLQEMEPYDAQERFFRLCKQPNTNYIVRDDFLPFIKALLNDHPVRNILLFLKTKNDTWIEFQHTCISLLTPTHWLLPCIYVSLFE